MLGFGVFFLDTLGSAGCSVMVVESDLRKRVSKCEMWLVTSGLAECVCVSL